MSAQKDATREMQLLDLSDERRAAKTWLPQSDRDVSEGRVELRRFPPLRGEYPACVKHGAMHRLEAEGHMWRCHCGVGCEFKPVALPVDPRCQVVLDFRSTNKESDWTFCHEPSTHYYPTEGGTMALCTEHAQRHLPRYAWPIGTPATWPKLHEVPNPIYAYVRCPECGHEQTDMGRGVACESCDFGPMPCNAPKRSRPAKAAVQKSRSTRGRRHA